MNHHFYQVILVWSVRNVGLARALMSDILSPEQCAATSPTSPMSPLRSARSERRRRFAAARSSAENSPNTVSDSSPVGTFSPITAEESSDMQFSLSKSPSHSMSVLNPLQRAHTYQPVNSPGDGMMALFAANDSYGDAEVGGMTSKASSGRSSRSNSSSADSYWETVGNNALSPIPFHTEVHLSSVSQASDLNRSQFKAEHHRYLYHGRPDLVAVLDSVRVLCEKEKIPRVAVFASGPPAMLNATVDYCRRTKMNFSERIVKFDCHSELFDL